MNWKHDSKDPHVLFGEVKNSMHEPNYSKHERLSLSIR